MSSPKWLVAVLCSLLAAGLCHGAERIEILLDASMGMWEPFQTGTPRIIAVRNAINAFAVSPEVSARRLEIGLRTFGGRTDFVDDLGCADTEILVQRGPVDPTKWSAALAELDPKGGRALVHAVEKTLESLEAEEGDSRIVIFTSGKDQCQRDIVATLEKLSQKDLQIRVRVIGLAIDGKFANSMLLSAPTKNVSNPVALTETLRWAILGQDIASTRPEWLDLHITCGDKPVSDATVRFPGPSGSEEIVASVDQGSARVRILPGLHRARLEGTELGPIELSGIVNHPTGRQLDIALVDHPPVTLDVSPERPLAGSKAYIQYWGAVPGENWLGVAVAGAPAGDFIVRAPATETEGWITLMLPDAPNELELQLTRDLGSGVLQLLGRVPFDTARRNVSIDAPHKVEHGAPLELRWTGERLQGDHVTIAANDDDDIAKYLLCVPVAEGKAIAVTAPAVAGEYVVRYLTSRGRTLDRSRLEVFEILATLDGPSQIAPGAEFAVAWTGPDAEHDFLSVAAAGDAYEIYTSFAPTGAGTPATLRAPERPGDYEVRYVRGTDGEVLARQQFVVAKKEISLIAPPVVEAGSRFEVEWTGTSKDGDFVAVAVPGSGVKNHLDWSFTSLGSPLTLAAPFDPGRYVVRYVSGEDQKVIAEQPVKVR